MTAQPIEEDLAQLAGNGYELRTGMADLAHLTEHAGADEPTGTWTGSGGIRQGLQVGSDADVAALRRIRAGAGRVPQLADVTWYPSPEMTGVLVSLVRMMIEDGQRGWRDHPLEWWEERRHAAWSYCWAANYEVVIKAMEGPRSTAGAPGLVVASFEHNSSEHGLESPHIHNVMPLRG